jgi:hypothetical protein
MGKFNIFREDIMIGKRKMLDRAPSFIMLGLVEGLIRMVKTEDM